METFLPEKGLEWRYVKGYGKNYIIWSNGDIVSLPRKMWNGWNWWMSKKRTLKPAILKIGYKAVVLVKDKKHKTTYIHRLLAEHFILNPLNKKQINHKDANKLNNDLSNLEWVTSKENVNHAFENGLMHPVGLRGEKNNSAKFTEKIVRKIRELKGRETLKETALKFNSCITNVWAIQNFKTWIHIK